MKALSLVFLLLGFGAGLLAANLIGPQAETVADASSSDALHARITALEAERDRWRQQATAATAADRRVAAPAQAATDASHGGATDGSTSATRPTGGSMKAASATPPEPPDPKKAAQLLADVEEALGAGDADRLQALAAGLAAQKDLVVPDLVKLLRNSDSLFAKEQLAEALGKLQDPRALPALHDLLKAEDNDGVRTAVVRALGLIPDPGSVPLLTVEFGRPSTSPMPASLAATSLGSIGSPEAITALKNEILTGKNAMVRAFALRALAEKESANLVPFFLEQVRRDGVSDRYRKSAIDAIVAAGDKGSIDQLRVIAMSPGASRAVQEAAKRAVNQLAGKKVFEVR